MKSERIMGDIYNVWHPKGFSVSGGDECSFCGLFYSSMLPASVWATAVRLLCAPSVCSCHVPPTWICLWPCALSRKKEKKIINSILPAWLSAFDCKKRSDLALLSWTNSLWNPKITLSSTIKKRCQMSVINLHQCLMLRVHLPVLLLQVENFTSSAFLCTEILCFCWKCRSVSLVVVKTQIFVVLVLMLLHCGELKSKMAPVRQI